MHKFEKLEVWQLAIEYADLCYALTEQLPKQDKYLDDMSLLREAYQASDKLAAKLQAMRRSILGHQGLREDIEEYQVDSRTPFDEFDNDG